MTRKLQLILASFAITLILFGALLGFMMVDLSSERYMPGRFGPFFQITGVGEEGVEFTWQGEDYLLESAPFLEAASALEPHRGLLPRGPQIIQRGLGLWGLYYEPAFPWDWEWEP